MADNEKLGSTSPQVLLKNAINLDKLVNDRESESLPDRFDVLRRTWFGMEKAHDRQMQSQENRFDTFIASSGYEVIGDYTAGPLTLTEYNQLIRYNNELYKLTAATDIPYTTAGTTDETWNATDSLHFVSVGDAALRQNLASTEESMGADLVAWKRHSLINQITNTSGMLDAQPIFCYEYANAITDKPNINDPTTWDWTPAINGAIAASKADRFQPVVLPHHAFITTGGHVITSNTPEFSGG
ncbi:TPA: hypothetical protein PTC37_004745, partial [Klebsiella pneumoniae]|nr:hypothetical protein [Klebsiella pneumoniae]